MKSKLKETLLSELPAKPRLDLSHCTNAQRDAVFAEGNVIVSAGAGSGKTSTLVDKCLYWLIDKGARLDELLVVTFTEAATGEMRRRMRDKLEKLAAQHPTNGRIQEHLDMFDTARISTIHSFCYTLVKEHFHILGLDPRVAIMQTDREIWVQNQTMDELLAQCYEDKMGEICKLLSGTFSSNEDKFRKVIERIHRFAMTQPCAAEWLEKQIEYFNNGKADHWKSKVEPGYASFVTKWYHKTKHSAAGNKVNFSADLPAAEVYGLLKGVCKSTSFAGQSEFWESILDGDSKIDPVQEDWDHCRKVALTLLRFTKDFSAKLLEVKQNSSQASFDDLQQYALALMRVPEVKEVWAKQFKLIVVDEYQDVTPAQDELIHSLRGKDTTVFLVGDVKQSIYGFRLATPDLFKAYIEDAEFKKFHLNANFRSHEALLDFINKVFDDLMTEGTAHLNYKETARLEFGGKEKRANLTREFGPGAKVEVHFLKDDKSQEDATLDKIEQEAWVIGTRLKEIKKENAELQWHDMAVLLRSLKGKFEQYARIFHKLGIPVAGNAETFEQSAEFQDLHSLLSVIDNFQQDIPLAAVMHSPFGWFTSSELAAIRSETDAKECRFFWQAVIKFSKGDGELNRRTAHFMMQCDKWRELQTKLTANELLEKILAETGYWNWIETQPRKQTRKEFVERFIQMATAFEKADGRGVNSFLRFLKAQEELDIAAKPPKSAAVIPGAVQIMSIHGSKGLEFPVVAVGDLGKKFNEQDLREDFIINASYGIAGLVHLAEKRYPSIAHNLAVQETKHKNAMEELRLLYVAMTRAKERLVLTGKCSTKQLENLHGVYASFVEPVILLETDSYMHWIVPILAQHGLDIEVVEGKSHDFSWKFYSPQEISINAEEVIEKSASVGDYEKVKKNLDWRYKFQIATTQAAKLSASGIKVNEEDEAEEANEQFLRPKFQLKKTSGAAEIGSGTHQFLEALDLGNCADATALKQQLNALVARKALAEEIASEVDVGSIANFWGGKIGKQILQHAKDVRRELPFTFRVSPQEFKAILPEEAAAFEGLDESDFIIMQGVVDLAVVRPEEIWVLDFKTDREPDESNTRKHQRQLDAYARALEAIYQKPVKRRWLHYLATNQTVELSGLDIS